MHSEDIEYFIDDVRYVGHLAVPDGSDPRPAVLVCHEGPGLTDHARSRARRLADELGYVALALDYWGDGKPLDGDQVMPRLGALMADQAETRRRASVALELLLDHPRADRSRVGAMGYCFGGTMSLELGRGGAPVHAIVGFHSGLANATPTDAANITGAVLVCIGVDDPIIPPSQRADFEAEMNAAGVDWQMLVHSGAGHSFTNRLADGSRPGFQYHEPSDLRSWRAMREHFFEVFGR
ncbi:MAG: dienelactone hydrolase family protein [Actinobacteria bacterium]|nr:dienelactone hydrolase family protein [Actinomycetota bacterium]